jgi:D-ribose pyranose/furanose isomerase RbsD
VTPLLKAIVTLVLLAASLPARAASPDWHQRLAEVMPLLGHRNWILVVDSAYPLQIAPGIETIDTGASHMDVLRAVMAAINHSIQVRPVIFTDAELPLISDSDAPGASAYREQLSQLARDYPAVSLRHDKIISRIDEAGKTFHVLVLKTNMTIPYTSVFIRLDCKYWSSDQERNLRSVMGTPPRR